MNLPIDQGRSAAAARRPFTLPLVLLGALASCSGVRGGSVYVHPNADMTAYERVAVLPLENRTVDRMAGERLRDILVVELAAQGLFEVVDVGEVNRVMRLQGLLDASELGPEEVQELGRTLDVQGLFLGSVIDYRERRTGSITAPDVAVSLRLMDVETGIVAWSVADARTGASLMTRLFGVGDPSMSEAARELTRDMLATLYY